MKIILSIFIACFSLSCSGQLRLDDTSLKVDTSKIIDVCTCNDAIILMMKENIIILTEVKRIGKQDPRVESLNNEYVTRIDKFHEIYTHCFPMYQQNRGDSECSNKTEAEKLEQELNGLKKELNIDQ